MSIQAQKAYAIINSIMSTATAVRKFAHVAYPPKRAFRKIDRRPLKRMNKNRARLQMLMALPMGAMQVAMIASQPVRKFPSGAPGKCWGNG